MKFSMNGFRRQLSNDTEALRNIARDVMNGDWYDKEDFVEAINQVIAHSNVLNCVSQRDDPEFIDMSELEIEHLELTPEGVE